MDTIAVFVADVQRDFMLSNPRIAVIGAGAWGKNHIRLLSSMGVLAAVHDGNPCACVDPPIVPLEAIWQNPEIKGVVIATPPHTHAELAEAALLAGKHVLVEKPMTLYSRDAKALVKLASDRQRILMVGHLMMFHDGFRKLKQQIKDGAVGEIEYVYSHRLQPGVIRQHENSMWSLAPHDLSMILSIMGMPIRVQAYGGNFRKSDIADVAMITMEFENSSKAHVFVTWLHPNKERKLVVMGSEGSLVMEQDSLNEPLKQELQQFIESIETGQTLLDSDGRAGIDVISVLDAAQESMDSHGKGVWIGSD